MSHFIGAIKISALRDPREFRRDMNWMLRDLRNMPSAEGAERVYFAGQKEFEAEAECRRCRIPLLEQTYAQFCDTAAKYGLVPPRQN